MAATIGRRQIPYGQGYCIIIGRKRQLATITKIHAAVVINAVLEQLERTVFYMYQNNLPDDVLSDYVREYVNSTRRESYARHPERVMRQRLTSAANLLNRHGLIDDRQRASILDAIKAVNA